MNHHVVETLENRQRNFWIHQRQTISPKFYSSKLFLFVITFVAFILIIVIVSHFARLIRHNHVNISKNKPIALKWYNVGVIPPSTCDLAVARGNCTQRFVRYYYDANQKNCLKFIYTGCFGNENRFLSEEECMLKCKTSNSRRFIHIQGSPCLDRFDVTQTQPCKRHLWVARYFYDISTRKCKMFWHDSSCNWKERQLKKSGKMSRNIFLHMRTCKKACVSSDESLYQYSHWNAVGVIQAIFSNVTGPNFSENYYEYSIQNTTTNNENMTLINLQEENFTPSLPAISKLRASVKNVELDDENNSRFVNTPTTNRSIIRNKNTPKTKFKKFPKFYEAAVADECLEIFDKNLTRSCSNENFPWVPRYYYDSTSRKCRMYWNNGCTTKSRNNFEDLAVCKWMCEGGYQSIENGRSCVHMFDDGFRGNCQNGRFMTRYYFDHNAKQCKMFYYGGCRSNQSRNIFVSYEDCLNTCESPTRLMSRQCRQPFDPIYRYPCSGHVFAQYYYYDDEIRACRTFWYGNCKDSESENIFSTLSACQWLCERNRRQTIPVACLDNFDESNRHSCDRKWTKKWYFDHDNGKCTSFWYGGCQTSQSQNIFPSQTSCSNTCELPVFLALEDSNGELVEMKADGIHQLSLKTNCLQEMEIGGCGHALPAYYYNKWSQKCEPFVYSGCAGNANRFLTLAQCQKFCAQFSKLTAQETDCILPLNQGNGKNLSTSAISELNATKIKDCSKNAGFRFSFSIIYGSCIRFWYFGCGGNANNFISYGACEKVCRKSILETALLTRNSISRPSFTACFLSPDKVQNNKIDDCSKTNVTINSQNDLSLVNSSTPEINVKIIWSFDISTKQCYSTRICNLQNTDQYEAINYEKRFGTKKECDDTCVKAILPKSNECAYIPDWGPCNQLRYMWFYNISSGSCSQFLWGGCGGNSNRFTTYDLCHATCEIILEDDPCLDALDRGRWCDRMSSRYYYHEKSNTCRGFHYTGCGKSRNNFRQLENCKQKCVRKRSKHSVGKKPLLTHGVVLSGPKESGQIETNGLLPFRSIQRHTMLNEIENHYIKSQDQWLNYNECMGFRYNVSGKFTRLTSYFCLMEEGGTCQVKIFWETSEEEECQLVQPWIRGIHHYSLFLIIDRRPTTITTDDRIWMEQKKRWRQMNMYFHNRTIFPDVYKTKIETENEENYNSDYRQDAEKTLAAIIILPLYNCDNIC